MAAMEDQESHENEGGLGGDFGIRDTRLLERAVRERWPIKAEAREALVERMVKIVTDLTTSPREATAAVKALVGMERQNQIDQHATGNPSEKDAPEGIRPSTQQLVDMMKETLPEAM